MVDILLECNIMISTSIKNNVGSSSNDIPGKLNSFISRRIFSPSHFSFPAIRYFKNVQSDVRPVVHFFSVV